MFWELGHRDMVEQFAGNFNGSAGDLGWCMGGSEVLK